MWVDADVAAVFGYTIHWYHVDWFSSLKGDKDKEKKAKRKKVISHLNRQFCKTYTQSIWVYVTFDFSQWFLSFFYLQRKEYTKHRIPTEFIPGKSVFFIF